MKTQTFLAGSKWAHGNMSQNPEKDATYFVGYESEHHPEECVERRDVKTRLTKREADRLETTLNALALSIVRYSASQWSNDYYDQVHAFRRLAEWLDEYEREHKFGQYYSLT